MAVEIVKVNNCKSRAKCAYFKRASSSLILAGTFKVTLENCTYIESGKYLIWEFLGTWLILLGIIKLNILVKMTRLANIREVVVYHTRNSEM